GAGRYPGRLPAGIQGGRSWHRPPGPASGRWRGRREGRRAKRPPSGRSAAGGRGRGCGRQSRGRRTAPPSPRRGGGRRGCPSDRLSCRQVYAGRVPGDLQESTLDMTTTARGGDAGAVASWRLWVLPLAAGIFAGAAAFEVLPFAARRIGFAAPAWGL